MPFSFFLLTLFLLRLFFSSLFGFNNSPFSTKWLLFLLQHRRGGKRQTLLRNQKRLSSARWQERAIKSTQTEKEETTSPSFTEAMIVYVHTKCQAVYFLKPLQWISLARPQDPRTTHKTQSYLTYKQGTTRNCIFFLKYHFLQLVKKGNR